MQGIPDKTIGEHYKVIEAFEHGLKCHDSQSDTLVWLKPMQDEIASDPVLLAEAKRRCETLKNIHHDGLARMLDVVSEEGGKTYMVIEYVEGVTLRRWMQEHRQEGVIPAKFSMPILKQLASALDLAHSYNEIHRHLMPECIMVTESGTAKILNLGLPYAGSDNEWVREPWRKNGWEAFYRAPEQWRGQICTTWTDVYALGCIAYEMLSGHVPFDIPDLNLLHGAVLLEMPPAILSLPVAAQGTITRSLAKKPSERFNSCEDYIRALAFETTPTKTVPKPTTGRVPAITQTTLGQDLANVAWTAVASAVNPYVSPRQDTGTLRGTTKNIPVALPSLPNTGTVRSITRHVPTQSVTKNVTGRYSPYSTSHVPLDPNNLASDFSWGDESQGVKGVLLKVVIPFIIVAIVASVMYYMLIQRMDELGGDDIVYTQEDTNQLTPNQIITPNPLYQDEEENTDEEQNTEEKSDQDSDKENDSDKGNDSDKENDSDKPSDDSSPSPSDESPSPGAQHQKEEGKTDSQTSSADSISGGSEQMSYGSDETGAVTPVKPRKKMPKSDDMIKKDALGTAIIEAYIGNQRIRNASITIGQKTFVGTVDAKAFISEKKKFDVSADFVDANQKSYHGDLSFVIDWGDKRIVKVKMVKVEGSAIIVATVDGKPVEGADVYIDGKSYKTPDCEIDTKLDVERKVDAKVFYHDDVRGQMFGSQSFVIDWRGPKNIYIELKERKVLSSAEKTERFLPLNVDDSTVTDTPSVAKESEDKPVFMELLWVEPGSFEMGSDSEDAGREEKPRHTVQITNGFWLGKYEVTQEEYRAMARFMGLDNDRSSYVGPRRPVESITRKDAEKWCEAITRKERDAGRLPYGYEYRLPTEAEWEYAARGGRNSRGYMFSGGNKLTDVAWFDANRGEEGTKNVGGLEKNELGFYDMSGNVREWCYDHYESYTLKPATDPLGRGEKVIARGGSWRNNMRGNRVTERANYEPGTADDYIGFRVALAPVLAD